MIITTALSKNGVPYKEESQEDGFVLTAYFTSDLFWLLKKEIIWSKE